jgi:hypothetical protein
LPTKSPLQKQTGGRAVEVVGSSVVVVILVVVISVAFAISVVLVVAIAAEEIFISKRHENCGNHHIISLFIF